jgi:dTDP-4-amino-4,6-dideoxygalactose transaminase
MHPGKNGKLIRLSKSCLSSLEKKYVSNVLDREFLGMGKEVNLFEKKLTLFFKRKSLCVVNGTAALQLALQAIGLKRGDEVLVQSLTYLSSYQAISAIGAKPIACDIILNSGTIDIEDARKKITKKTKAIMPVHYAGGVGDLKKVYEFAKKFNIRVVEDAAHAFGTKYKNKLIGSQGDIVCFSFDGIKNITSGEGGCVVTNDKKVIQSIKDSRLLGIQGDTKKRYKNSRTWVPVVNYQGWRYHMSNIMAAIGIVQLKRFKILSLKRKKLAKFYDKKLLDQKNILTFKQDYKNVVPHIYPIRIKKLKNRLKLIDNLKKKKIEVGYHYFPNHKLNFYKKKGINLKNTDELFPELLTLPMHPDITDKEANYIVKTFLKILPFFL